MVSVSLVKCNSYNQEEVNTAVKKAVDLIGGMKHFIKSGEDVLLKPNILYGKSPEAGVTTHPAILRAVINLVKQECAIPFVGESSGGPIDTMKAAKKAGILAVCEETKTKFIEFKKIRKVNNPNGVLMKSFEIADEMRSFNKIINLPKLKTHSFQIYTGAVKNTYGCIPGMRKIQFHVKMQDPQSFASLLIDLHTLINPCLNIMDGIIGMEGMGPGSGDKKQANLISASSSAISMDSVLTKLIGIKNVYVVKEAEKRKMMEANSISVVGETPESFNLKFKLPHTQHGSLIKKLGIKILKNQLTQYPFVKAELCIHCRRCESSCPVKAIHMEKGIPHFDYGKCIRCYCCHEMCPVKAINLKKPILMKLFSKSKKSKDLNSEDSTE